VKGREGSVRRFRSGRWQAYLPPSLDPLKRPIGDPSFETRAEAEAALAAACRGIRDGSITLEMPGGVASADAGTVEAMMRAFLLERADLAPSTLRSYRAAIPLICDPTVGVGRRLVRSLTVSDMRAWERGLLASGRKPSMVALAWRALSAALGWEVEHGRLPVSPAVKAPSRGVKGSLPRRQVHADHLLTWEQLGAVCACMARAEADLTLVMAWGGLRLSEAAALTWGDLRGGAVRVERVWDRDLSGEWQMAPAKGGRPRVVTLPAGLSARLERHRHTDPSRSISPPLSGPAWSRWGWRDQVWKLALQSAGLSASGITTHSLRGLAASTLMDAGATLLEAQQHLGHSEATTTARHYARLLPEQHDPERAAIRTNTALNLQGRLDALFALFEQRHLTP